MRCHAAERPAREPRTDLARTNTVHYPTTRTLLRVLAYCDRRHIMASAWRAEQRPGAAFNVQRGQPLTGVTRHWVRRVPVASGSAVPAKQRQGPPASLPSARRPFGVGPRPQPRLSPRAQLPLGGGGARRRSAGTSDGHAAEGEGGMRRSCSRVRAVKRRRSRQRRARVGCDARSHEAELSRVRQT